MEPEVTSLAIADVKLVVPRRLADARGYFVETWHERIYAGFGVTATFVQDNCSLSHSAGTIRGLHFQCPPAAQAKLIRVVRGRAFDVAVDLRSGSPTYRRFVSAELTAEGGEQLFIPVGFAHGFCTLEPNTEVAYKVSEFYAPDLDAGICWNDADIGIEWPLAGRMPIVSERDMKLPRLAECPPPF